MNGRHVLRFVLHYLEMLVAMAVGMMLLGPVWLTLVHATGLREFAARPDVAAIVMALEMAFPMAAWMWFRGHRWSPIWVMAAAMVAPFVVLLVPFWFGALSGGEVMLGGHVLMLLTMLGAMLLQREDYVGGHCRWRIPRRKSAVSAVDNSVAKHPAI